VFILLKIHPIDTNWLHETKAGTAAKKYFCSTKNKNIKMKSFKLTALWILAVWANVAGLQAGTVLTLEECRSMALENNGQSKIAREKINAAEYDRKAAFANYLPKLSATGLYLHNSSDINLVSPDMQTSLAGIGTITQTKIGGVMQSLMADAQFQQLLATDPSLRYLMGKMSTVDIREALNGIGQEVADNLSIDLDNVYVGVVSLEQPLYVGGKISAYNKVTAYAQELAEVQLEGEDSKLIVAVDEAYWQIVSVAAKLRLTEKYVELLEQMDRNVGIMQKEGVATQSDALSVRVRLNEAQMAKVKAENGLILSRMLLCQLCGLPLDGDITLKDESQESLVVPSNDISYTEQDILKNRPELRSLDLAVKMYDEKSKIVRADYLPTLALMGNYVVSNPSFQNGIKYDFNGMWNVGVVAKIPLFHFGEGMNKYRKAKSDVNVTRYQLDDARQKVNLQVSQYERKISEADSRLEMSRSNMEAARENLRVAEIGFKEGVVETSLVMAAQTAWLKAGSEEIDATIDRIMASVYLSQATGMLK